MFQIAALSVTVSASATLLAAAFAIPCALWIVHGKSGPRTALSAFFAAGLGLPPVAVGLAVAFALWRSGPLGSWDLLYTPTAMAIAQTIIVIPLVGTLSILVLRTSDVTLSMQLAGLGVRPLQRFLLIAWEVAPGLAAALLAGFGRAIAEVGAAQMTGGNILDQTRVLTTATMLAVGKGEFGTAFSYVAMLLGIMAIAAGVALILQRRWA